MNLMCCGGKVADTLWEGQLWFFMDDRNMYSFDMHLWEYN